MKPGLFQQLHYNYNYTLKIALQDYKYAKDRWYDEQVLKPKFSVNNSDVWHAPWLLDDNITEDPNTESHQLVTVMLAPVEDQDVPSSPVTKNQALYEHETVNVYVKQLKVLLRLLRVIWLVRRGKWTKKRYHKEKTV